MMRELAFVHVYIQFTRASDNVCNVTIQRMPLPSMKIFPIITILFFTLQEPTWQPEILLRRPRLLYL
jgi:hypothetical protein